MDATAKIRKYVKEPKKIFLLLAGKGLLNWMPDKLYIKLRYRVRTGKWPNLADPKTFNEKLQWLKLYDRNPMYTTLVDKYAVKDYIASIIGKQYIIPTLGVWDSFDEINFDYLPDQFVLKCTHDSGGLVICKDKSTFNIAAARKKINRSLKTNFFKIGREWPYKDVPKRIIAEQYMEDSTFQELRDYKFFCFGGVAKCFKVDYERYIEHHANYYDMENNLLDFGEKICPPVFEKKIDFPQSLNKMKEFAGMLSITVPFLRVDFYDVNGKIYFGELTFFPASGFGEFTSNEWDTRLGSWIKLPSENIK